MPEPKRCQPPFRFVTGQLQELAATLRGLGVRVGVGEVLAYVSRLMTLEPGDLVITGTPAGVAMGQPEPRPYLRHGDVVELDGGVLGRQRSRVVDPAAESTLDVVGVTG